MMYRLTPSSMQITGLKAENLSPANGKHACSNGILVLGLTTAQTSSAHLSQLTGTAIVVMFYVDQDKL